MGSRRHLHLHTNNKISASFFVMCDRVDFYEYQCFFMALPNFHFSKSSHFLSVSAPPPLNLLFYSRPFSLFFLSRLESQEHFFTFLLHATFLIVRPSLCPAIFLSAIHFVCITIIIFLYLFHYRPTYSQYGLQQGKNRTHLTCALIRACVVCFIVLRF